MILKELTTDHYIIVDDLEIKEGDWLYSFDNGLIVQANSGSANTINSKSLNGRGYSKITHSTQPIEYEVVDVTPTGDAIEGYVYDKIQKLSLSEVKELIGGVDVDVENKASEYAVDDFDDYAFCGYIKGYNQALEDNKDKKYTEEDMRRAIEMARDIIAFDQGMIPWYKFKFVDIIQSIQPKTDWEVEFDENGKLRLV